MLIMSHELEFCTDGTARMVYSGATPWHNLGKEIPADLTPEQVLEEAGLDWTVEKVPAYATIAGKKTSVGWSFLMVLRVVVFFTFTRPLRSV
jgi:hypothetical protein